MLVTILTVVYNGESSIAKTIESVLNQTHRDIEYIILDGYSKDNTVSIAKSYIDKFAKTEGKTLTVISEPDKGMYDALNKGAKLAKGVLVGQINAGDTYETDAVSTMVDLYERDSYDVAWGSINVISSRKTFVKHAKIKPPHMMSCFCHPAMFSRREVLLENPYALETMYDDTDFIISVCAKHKKLTAIDKVIANYPLGGMGKTSSWKDVQKHMKLIDSIYRKHYISKRYYIQKYLYEIVKYIVNKFL